MAHRFRILDGRRSDPPRGLLINYWDSSQSDNNTSAYPGEGLILPIDAHPAALLRADGTPERNRVQTFDATFGLDDTDRITLHSMGRPKRHRPQPGVFGFDDNLQYWNPATPRAGVRNPNTDTQIDVVSMHQHGTIMRVEVH